MNRLLNKLFSMENTLVLLAGLLLSFVAIKRIISKKPSQGKDEPTLGVQTLVENVKNDLEQIDIDRIKQNKAALFNVKTFDLEINFIAKKTNSSDAKFDYQVVTLGGGEEVSQEQVQKIMLHFEAVAPDKTIKVKADTTDNPFLSPKQ
jgi:Trypsin-co-occurring domain 2